jgi:hypothetical protein
MAMRAEAICPARLLLYGMILFSACMLCLTAMGLSSQKRGKITHRHGIKPVILVPPCIFGNQHHTDGFSDKNYRFSVYRERHPRRILNIIVG